MSTKKVEQPTIADLLKLKANVEESIIKIITDNFVEFADMYSTEDIDSELYPVEEIDLNIKKNERAIRVCINEYIKEFGVNVNDDIDEEWLQQYIAEYFEG